MDLDHPNAGKIKVPNFPVKLTETPGEVVSAAPLLGQHNKEILMEILGYAEEDVEKLEKEKVISTQN